MRRILLLGSSFLLSLAVLVNCGGGGGGYGGGGGGGGGAPGGNGIVTTIKVTPANAKIAASGTQQYTAVGTDGSGNMVNNVPYTWTSSDTSVATVDKNGLATAKSAGSTQISASISYTSSGSYGSGYVYTSNMAALTVTAADMVMGTAATGRALQGAMVTLMDARGRSQSTLSDSTGRFQLSIAGLAAPFLLKADDGHGHVLYGAAAAEGVANVDTVTDFMLRAWATTRGSSMDAAFAAHAGPDAKSLKSLDQAFTALMADSLTAAGLDVQKFSVVSTSFDADGKGFDHVLDNVSASGLSLDDRLSGATTLASGKTGELLLSTTHADVSQLRSEQRVALP